MSAARGGTGPPPAPAVDHARGLLHPEGFLVWQAEVGEVRRQAHAFADRLPWLTSAQREELVGLYTADRLALSREVVLRIAERARDLQTEYEERYRALSARLWGASLTLLAGAAFLMLLAACGR